MNRRAVTVIAKVIGFAISTPKVSGLHGSNYMLVYDSDVKRNPLGKPVIAGGSRAGESAVVATGSAARAAEVHVGRQCDPHQPPRRLSEQRLRARP
ncbi:EutN/CcmL family microcompartment protein [Streptomyces sp. NPDC058424]|uniref:EutN/CcmL family microcompartment protein n=1 Tax=Streptomyces sp. NPDC058424 TaxID=3346491 RepID=UPI003653100B